MTKYLFIGLILIIQLWMNILIHQKAAELVKINIHHNQALMRELKQPYDAEQTIVKRS